jgi:hypothetical protein
MDDIKKKGKPAKIFFFGVFSLGEPFFPVYGQKANASLTRYRVCSLVHDHGQSDNRARVPIPDLTVRRAVYRLFRLILQL